MNLKIQIKHLSQTDKKLNSVLKVTVSEAFPVTCYVFISLCTGEDGKYAILFMIFHR